MRNPLLVSMALVLSTAAYGQTATVHKAAQVRQTVLPELSSEQIRTSIVGNTVTGVEGGEAYAEFLRPDGTVSGRAKSGRYSGEWRISGNRICFLYKEEKKNWDCSHVKIRGSQIVWAEKGAGATASALVKGNPRGL